MSRIGRPVLTAAETRAAEAAVMAEGVSVEELMERAGARLAEAALRFAGPIPALILCGPGNNGGDGYVAARLLRERGGCVRVAAIGEPATAAARAALEAWGGPVEDMDRSGPAPLLIDALFGTGLSRGLEDGVSAKLVELATHATVRIAVDLPSGAASDNGALLSPVPDFDLTVALGALKPSHLLQPAARHMGRLVVADIGLGGGSRLSVIDRPRLRRPGPDDHKYRRGYVAVVGGAMPGAAALAASAAAKAGAGYVRLTGAGEGATTPLALVRSAADAFDWQDPRIGAIVAGPGWGRSEEAAALLARALASARPLMLDADALHLIRIEDLAGLAETPILTPHAGEFERLFGTLPGSKLDQAREAARHAHAVLVYKGADTVVAAPDGRAAIGLPAPAWLASAGTGDVLAGVIAAMRASGQEPFEAACGGVWLHSRAAEIAGPLLIADDLLPALGEAAAECL